MIEFTLIIIVLFSDALKKMYPSMTDDEYKTAVQKALKAAFSRVDQRKRKFDDGDNPSKKRKLVASNFSTTNGRH